MERQPTSAEALREQLRKLRNLHDVILQLRLVRTLDEEADHLRARGVLGDSPPSEVKSDLRELERAGLLRFARREDVGPKRHVLSGFGKPRPVRLRRLEESYLQAAGAEPGARARAKAALGEPRGEEYKALLALQPHLWFELEEQKEHVATLVDEMTSQHQAEIDRAKQELMVAGYDLPERWLRYQQYGPQIGPEPRWDDLRYGINLQELAAVVGEMDYAGLKLKAQIEAAGKCDPAPRAQADWRDVQAWLLALAGEGKPFTSGRDLAKRRRCARETVRKAIDRSEPLRDWRRAGRAKLARVRGLTDVDLERLPAPGLHPADQVAQAEIDAVLHQLLEENEDNPEVRAYLNGLNEGERSELAQELRNNPAAARRRILDHGR